MLREYVKIRLARVHLTSRRINLSFLLFDQLSEFFDVTGTKIQTGLFVHVIVEFGQS